MRGESSTQGRVSPTALVEALWSARHTIRQKARARVWREATARRVSASTVDAVLDAQQRQIFTALGKIDDTDNPRPDRPLAPVQLWDRCDVIFAVSSAAFREFVDCAREIDRQLGGEPEVLLDVVRVVAEICDKALPRFVWESHSEVAQIRWNSAPRTRLARLALLGGASSAEIRAQATLFAIDTEREYLAFRARPSCSRQDLTAELVAAVTKQGGNGLVVDIDGDVVGFLPDPPGRIRSGVVGLGLMRPLDRLAESFQLATRALEVIQAFELKGAHSFSQLGLLPAVLSDMDTAESLRNRFLQPWQNTGSPPQMLDTIRAYFACGMDTDRAAGKLLLHPNSLRYRISRFEEMTGVSLRDPAEAMQVWWALQAARVTEAGVGSWKAG